MSETILLTIVVTFLVCLLGFRMEMKFNELIKVISIKNTPFPYTYLDHASNEKSYETGSNANYWLLLAVISLLSDGEF